MYYKKALEQGSALKRKSILFYFNSAFDKIPEQQDLALMCSEETPFDNEDKEVMFYLIGSKINYADKLINEFGFESVETIPLKNLHFISGYKNGLFRMSY